MMYYAREYHPDLKEDHGLEHADDLKARLRELGVTQEADWNVDDGFTEILWPNMGGIHYEINGYSKLTEGAALLEACAKLAKELAKESNNG